MISIYLILILLFTHYIGDWIVQSREDAEKKSHSLESLTHHVFTYTVTLYIGSICAMFWMPDQSRHSYIINILDFVAINSLLHWITDFFTSQINARNWKRCNYKEFWNGIGMDQLFHYITLFLTAYWLLT